jgi:hypothetical protein
VPYRTLSDDGAVVPVSEAGHPSHGTVDAGTIVEGVEVEINGELYIDLGTGEVPTGPEVPGTDTAVGKRKLLPLHMLDNLWYSEWESKKEARRR